MTGGSRAFPRRGVVSLVVLTLLACGGDAEVAPDGSPERDAGWHSGVEMPTPPEPPRMTTGGACPGGWSLVMNDGQPGWCEPWAYGASLDCPPGQLQYPGSARCVASSPCPEGDFADDLPSDREIVYVLSGPAGGSGSLLDPYGRLSDVRQSGLGPGAIIALSKGTHEGPIRLASGVSLWGACAAETTLRATTAHAFEPVLRVLGSDTEVRSLRIADSPRRGIAVDGPSASAHLQAVELSGLLEAGLFSEGGARVTARRLRIRDTRLRSDGIMGRAVNVQFGSVVQLSEASLEGNHDAAIFVATAGSSARLEQVVVRATRPRSNGLLGRGITMFQGGRAELLETLFEGNHGGAIFAHGPESSLLLESVVVRHTLADGQSDGRGLALEAGASATASRLLVEHSVGLGIVMDGAGGRVSLEDVLVLDTHLRADGTGGRGLGVQGGAHLEAHRLWSARNHSIGLTLVGEGTQALIEDLTVIDTAPRTDGEGGRGVNAELGASLELRRALVRDNREFGVIALGASMDLQDLVVVGTKSRAFDGRYGVGLQAQDAAMVRGTGIWIDDNQSFGVLSMHPASGMELSRVVVRRTAPRGCSETTCTDAPNGVGLASFVRGFLSVRDFEVSDSALCGAVVDTDGQLRLADGVVARNTLGLCLHDEDVDLDGFTSGVEYRDNETNLQATRLPVPDPAAPLSD